VSLTNLIKDAFGKLGTAAIVAGLAAATSGVSLSAHGAQAAQQLAKVLQ